MVERKRESVRGLHSSVDQNPTHLENAEFLFTKTFAVALEQVVDPRQERIVHDAEALKQLGVAAQLLFEEDLLLGAEPELALPLNPIQVFERRVRVLLRLLFGIEAADCGSLKSEIVRFESVAARSAQQYAP